MKGGLPQCIGCCKALIHWGTQVMVVFRGKNLMSVLLHKTLDVHSPAAMESRGCSLCQIPSRQVYLQKLREAYEQGMHDGYVRAQVIHIVEELKKERTDGA